MSQVDETTFTKAFLSLLTSNAEKKLGDDYVCANVANRPVSLPEMPQAKKKRAQSAADASGAATSTAKLVNVTLKSIKGVKFTTALQIPADETIYAVKERVIADQSLQGYKPSHVRLLLKGRVQLDSSTLEQVSPDQENFSLTVMLTAPQTDEAATTTTEPEPPLQVVDLTADDWKAIRELLTTRMGEEKANLAFIKLQKGWD